jgi:hypothetical protein
LKGCTSVHGPLDELDSVDVAFDRAVAPGLLKSREENEVIVA